MFSNYFKAAWRNLTRHGMYSSIKIGGFALGIAACLLITLYIFQELNYDRHYPKAAQIYRVLMDWGIPNARTTYVPAPFAETLKKDFPEVEQSGRFLDGELFGAGNCQLRRADQQENTYEEGLIFADQELINMLQIPFVYGSPTRALDKPNTIVITRRKADKYFPHENPVGKTLILNDNRNKPYEISGVIEDFPVTSHLQCDFIMTMKGVEMWPGEQTHWLSTNYHTYFLLRPGTDVAKFESKLSAIKNQYVMSSAQTTKDRGIISIFEKSHFEIQALTDIHLRSTGIDDSIVSGDIRLVWLFGAIAVFILIIAGINFVNLSTARSAQRAKEVGVRKSLGSDRASLVRQFLSESLLFALFSFILGTLLACLLLPYFNTLAGKSLSFPWNDWRLIPLLAIFTVITGILAGLYPSLYLSSFQPVQVLKGGKGNDDKRSYVRNALVIFQFTTSITLIIGTLVIYRQMQYILDKKVGFDKDQVLLLQGANTIQDKVPALKKVLLELPGVKSATISDYLPVAGTKRNDNLFVEAGKSQETSFISGQLWEVDEDYIKTMGMQVVNGRNFSINMPTDREGVIINQTMAKQLGLRDPVGKRISNADRTWTVVGLVSDFHFESFREQIRPLALVLGKNAHTISIKAHTADMPHLIRSVTAIWKDFSPHQPIRYTFMDQRFTRMYSDVQRTGSIFTSLAVLAIIVACLGLLGLSAFMAEQRTKEIAIRKVLGASVQDILRLLSKDFLKLVLVAIILAIPVAWYAMGRWLENFAYHINIEWWVCVLASILAIVIALLTVSIQSIKAALMNPITSIKAE